jgi:iron complex outermembrane receptor protein
MRYLLLAGASALCLATNARAADDAEAPTVSGVIVTAPTPASDLSEMPTTQAGVTAETIGKTINLVTPEDALRYLPDILIRQRHIGDTQSPVTTRTSGVGASARSLIYVDGVLISSLIGNNNTSASPKWGLVSPDAIARVDVLYGPFAAAYAGNSIGAVIAFTTRMPTALEASAEVQGGLQDFSKYGDDKRYGTGRFAADLGDRLGSLAFRLSYNHLDSRAQPLTYATATVQGAGTAGTPVTGAFADANRNGVPIQVLGSTAIEHQVQDNLSGRLTYDLTPNVTAAYTFGLFHNDDDAGVTSYLRDASDQPVYTGSVNIAGHSYSLANGVFSGGVYRLDELQLAQGLSLGSHSGGTFDFNLVATAFDYVQSRQRAPSGALPAAFAGGAGSTTALDGTGWHTLDASGTWRPSAANTLTFGVHEDGFRLDNPKYAVGDWIDGSPGATQTLNKGRTETQALWLQDAWSVTPELKATLGARYEHWRAYDGVNFSAAPALDVAQPKLSDDAISPKATLAWTPAADWTFTRTCGPSARFPASFPPPATGRRAASASPSSTSGSATPC